MVKNCWETKNCGREPGGAKAPELGVCPATIDERADGLNRGKNGGRICWAVAGTLCGGKIQGEFANKQLACMDCNHLQLVRGEEGGNFLLMPSIDSVEGALRASEAVLRAHERIRELAAQLQTRNEFIRQAFGRYLSDEVVSQLLETPEGLALGGESRPVTVMMADLRGFSPLAENLHPKDVILLLNNYLGTMTEIVLNHGGTIDEFIGDAILALFGAPVASSDHARRAVACAVEMQLGMKRVNSANREMGLPAVEMGIGLNTGEVIVGNIGSEKRSKYGVVGRNVNLASRIEAFTVGGQILISEATLQEAGESIRIDDTLEVQPKGATRPMKLFSVGGVGGEYDLQLARQEDDLRGLGRPIDVCFGVLDGKRVTAPDHRGTLTHLSKTRAILLSTSPVEVMATVSFLFGPGSVDRQPVFAKVVKAIDGTRLELRFTSMPGETARAIEDAMAGAVG